jgi:hypothetical protein
MVRDDKEYKHSKPTDGRGEPNRIVGHRIRARLPRAFIHSRGSLGSLQATPLKTRLPTVPLFSVGDFLRVGLPARSAESIKGLCRMTNLCGVSHSQMAKVEIHALR